MSNLLQIQTTTKKFTLDILKQSKMDEYRPRTQPEPVLSTQAVSFLLLGPGITAVQDLTEFLHRLSGPSS